MSQPRSHPFELVFGEFGRERFADIRAVLGTVTDLNAWLMAEPVVGLLSELRPDDGLGRAVDDFVIFVHAAYLWWTAGEITTNIDSIAFPIQGPMYIQVPPRRIWARLGDEEVHEPLDGWFVIPAGKVLRVVGCLGLHPARPGLSVLVAEGSKPEGWHRSDGSKTFAPLMTGGDTAGLASIGSPEEMLLLAWGVHPNTGIDNGNDEPESSSLGD